MRPFLRVLERLGRGEEGVAFVATLALFMFMYVVCIGVYAVGTQVKERIQLQNACDAAAYSAAVVQADTLSRIATINRAMAWTYVQMTRRQMDCIVARWLQRSRDIYYEDLTNGIAWNKKMSVCFPCDKGHDKGQVRGDTCWCGVDENSIGEIWVNGLSSAYEKVPVVGQFLSSSRDALNSIPGGQHVGLGRAVAMSDIEDRLNKFKLYSANMTYLWRKSGDAVGALASLAGDDFLLTQIAFDKLAIKLMNLAELDLVYELDGRIDRVVEDVLRANVTDEDFARIRFMVKHKSKPFTWFKYLQNTKEDEQHFMSFAGYYGHPYEVFRGDSSVSDRLVSGLFSGWEDTVDHAFLDLMGNVSGYNVVNGVDRWFVRGNGQRRAKDSDIGIQRSYKRWNEDLVGQLIGQDGTFKHSKYATVEMGAASFTLPPTCLNFNGSDNSESDILRYCANLGMLSKARDDGLPSIGLYSEWQWYSMSWFCYLVPFPIPYVVHQSVSPLIPVGEFEDKHLDWDWKISKGNENCIYLPGKVVPCSYKTYYRKKWRIKKRWRSSAGGMTTDFGIPCFRGYTRVYADDPSIWRDEYVGEKCLPLLLNPTYFAEDGKITVGLARKNDNPWAEIIWRFMSVVDKGPFAAFDPLTKWSWAFSTSTAGYCQDHEKNAYVVSWPEDHETGGSWKRPAWNLCEANWDAVLVPVAESASYGYQDMWISTGASPLNSLVHSGLWQELRDWEGRDSGNEDKDWDRAVAHAIPAGLSRAFEGSDDESERRVNWGRIGALLRH